MDNLNYPGNNSPTFNTEPVVFACCNQLILYNQSATNIDGDSISYSLYEPLGNAINCATGIPLNYIYPFSFTNPIHSAIPITINSKTGYLTLNPTTCYEMSVFGIRVDEYRKGVLIGSVFRDNVIRMTHVMLSIDNSKMNELGITISPNPFSDILQVKVPNPEVDLFMYNSLGILVYKQKINKMEMEFDLSAIAKGSYLLVFQSAGTIYRKQLTKM